MTKRILTVDDSRTMREMITYTLAQAGYEVLEAEDGQNALAVLNGKQVDCVIADLNMPIMNGLELTRALRASPDRRGLPILILTTEFDEQKKTEGRQAGATGWLVKPFDPDRLVQTVRRVCQ